MASWSHAGVGLLLVFGLGTASVEAATCSHDPATRAVTIHLSGEAATLSAPSGTIRLDVASCGAATVHNTDSVSVVGTASVERFTIDLSRGPFAPGATPEADQSPEIEVAVDLGPGADTLLFKGTAGEDVLVLGAAGFDWNADDDLDVALAGLPRVGIYGGDGDDFISGAGSAGTGAAWALPLSLLGEGADDCLVGGTGDDRLYGGPGGDALAGDSGADLLIGGAGDDVLSGDEGDDKFLEEVVADGADIFSGGPGSDTVSYERRTQDVEASIDDVDNDGELGLEGDNVGLDVERLAGGAGDDILIGSDGPNWIAGYTGDDELDGGAGDDVLNGGEGNDCLWGTDGADRVLGANGDDLLSGGEGDDVAYGGAGEDTVYGDEGRDTLYGEGGADSVDGGPGADWRVSCGLGVDTGFDPDGPVHADCELLGWAG